MPDALIEKLANIRIPLKLEVDSEKYTKHLNSIWKKNMKKKGMLQKSNIEQEVTGRLWKGSVR